MMLDIPSSLPLRAADPTFEPVTLAEAKKQVELPAEYAYHNDFLLSAIQSAREIVEHDTGIITATGSFTWKLTTWPSDDFLELPLRPVSAITSIVYRDTSAVNQTFSSTKYALDNSRARPVIYLTYDSTWASDLRAHTNDITVTLVAGYSARTSIPMALRQAVLLQVARIFADREGGQADDSARAYEMLIRRLQRSSYP